MLTYHFSLVSVSICKGGRSRCCLCCLQLMFVEGDGKIETHVGREKQRHICATESHPLGHLGEWPEWPQAILSRFGVNLASEKHLKPTPWVEDRNLLIVKVKESKIISSKHSFPLQFPNILNWIKVITGRRKCQSRLGKGPNVENATSKYSSSFNYCFRRCCLWTDLRKNQVCLQLCSQAAKNVTNYFIYSTGN